MMYTFITTVNDTILMSFDIRSDYGRSTKLHIFCNSGKTLF